MNNKKALGRGLESLFNNESLDFDQIEKKIIKEANEEEIIEISLNELRSNPYQPRKVFDEKALNELAKSIEEHGVFQPIIVKKSIKGYEIIAGERRVKASKLINKEKIPAIVREFNDEQMMEIALLENLQRENLSAIEEAYAYNNLINKLGLTQEKLAKRLGKSRSHITNMIGLLRLPNSVQNLVLENKITMGHARILSKLENEKLILELTEQIINENLSVRELEDIVSTQNYNKKNKIKKGKENKNLEYKYIEEIITEKLGTKVKVSNKKIQISFTNVNDLNRILEIMKIEE